MNSTGILVVIGTVEMNEIKLHRNIEGTEKVAVLGLSFKELMNLQRSQRWKNQENGVSRKWRQFVLRKEGSVASHVVGRSGKNSEMSFGLSHTIVMER